MVKKLMAFVLTIALVASLCLIPTSAKVLDEDTLVLDVDFSTGSADDQSGLCTGPVEPEEEFLDGSIEFVEDETLGKTVAHLQSHVLQYTLLDTSEVAQTATLETYVNVHTRTFGLVAGTYWYSNPHSGLGIIAGAFSDIGWDRGLSAVTGHDGSSYTTKIDKDLSYDQWVHLVIVHNETVDYFYVNGELVGEQDSVESMEHSDFRIGGYNLAGNFDIGEMKMAFCRLYNVAASADEVAEMYSEATGGAAVEPSEDPSEEPSEEPSDENNATPVPTKPADVDNTTTFDLGLVSLAAVALSSVVAVKKRK